MNIMRDAKKLPIIRPGQRKPYVKATRQQIDERRGYVARLLRAGKTKTQIHRAIREKFGIEWRQCDRYIAWLTKSDAPDT
jgi:hypothetical protein